MARVAEPARPSPDELQALVNDDDMQTGHSHGKGSSPTNSTKGSSPTNNNGILARRKSHDETVGKPKRKVSFHDGLDLLASAPSAAPAKWTRPQVTQAPPLGSRFPSLLPQWLSQPEQTLRAPRPANLQATAQMADAARTLDGASQELDVWLARGTAPTGRSKTPSPSPGGQYPSDDDEAPPQQNTFLGRFAHLLLKRQDSWPRDADQDPDDCGSEEPAAANGDAPVALHASAAPREGAAADAFTRRMPKLGVAEEELDALPSFSGLVPAPGYPALSPAATTDANVVADEVAAAAVEAAVAAAPAPLAATPAHAPQGSTPWLPPKAPPPEAPPLAAADAPLPKEQDARPAEALLRARQTENGSLEVTALGYGVSFGRDTGFVGVDLRSTFDWATSSWFGTGGQPPPAAPRQPTSAPWWSCAAPRKDRAAAALVSGGRGPSSGDAPRHGPDGTQQR